MNVYKKNIISFFEDSLFRNASFLVGNSFIGSFTGFVFWLIAARLYTAEDIGLATTILSVIGFLALFSDFGFTISIIRYIPLFENKNKLINTCVTVSSLTAILFSAIFIYGVSVFSPELLFLKHDFLYSIVFIFYAVLVILVALLDSVFIAFRCARYSFFKMCIQSILKLPILVVMVTSGSFGLVLSFFLAYLFASLLSFYVFIPKICPSYKPFPEIDYLIIKKITLFSISNFIARLFESFPSAILPILITNILSPEKTAYFYMVWMIATVIYIIPKSVSTSLFAEGSNNNENLELQIRKSTKISLKFVIPTIVTISLFGDNILSLFGQEYSSNGLQLLWLFLLAGIPVIFNNINIAVKQIEKDIKHVIIIYGIISVGTLLISYLTLEKWGIISIGIAWLFSQSIALISSYIIDSIKKNYFSASSM